MKPYVEIRDWALPCGCLPGIARCNQHPRRIGPLSELERRRFAQLREVVDEKMAELDELIVEERRAAFRAV
jgi:hypothetical protein